MVKYFFFYGKVQGNIVFVLNYYFKEKFQVVRFI